MKRVDYDSPAFIHDRLHNAPYSSSLATSASASSSSVWSNASSQKSDDTSITAPTSDIELGESACPLSKLVDPWVKPKSQQQQLQIEVVVPSELRQNPRRSSTSSTTRSGCPPPLVRQADRKVNFVDNLVDSATHIVEAIWPTSSVFCRTELNGVLPLRTFIQETLRRSRSSYSTLQVALYYLILIKPHVPAHDFTMEQPDDCHASRALQCGRRMFLAALILASKYLQDRNYSSRAWSKISGLATNEINQNETAFLLAVNWKLHITEEIYHRWTDCVMKFSPQPPPSPPSLSFELQVAEFRDMIMKLTPELDNLEDLAPCTPVTSRSLDFPAVPQRWSSDRPAGSRLAYEVTDVPLTPRSYGTPSIMEPPTPTAVYTPGRMAPAMGLLPTPRLTPQSSAYSTPAVTAVSHLLGKPAPSMGFAMAQISSVSAAQALDRWPGSSSSSPQSYLAGGRRSSLANTISTASSPESMVSDSSRASRSSSISSASSLASAPSTKLDVLARRRSAKQYGERAGLRPAIASVPEDYEETRLSSSPESYTGPVAMDLVKEHAVLSLETPLGRRERAMMDDQAAVPRTALDLHGLPRPAAPVASFAERKAAGVKRRRQPSLDIKSSNLQENVREMLSAPLKSSVSPWSDNLVRARLASSRSSASDLTPIPLQDGRKRLCCSTEALQSFSGESTYMHPSMTGLAGPGMWQGFLP